MKREFLQQLCNAHSTPNKEEEVFYLMKQCFEGNNWKVNSNKHYLLASKHFSKDLPTVLLTAHADSPGWEIINQIAPETADNNFYNISSQGDISSWIDAEVVIKTATKKIEGKISKGKCIVKNEDAAGAKIHNGDSICFKSKFIQNENILEATFLDNRIGCFLLSGIAADSDNWEPKNNIVLAVTSSEETNCSGADKLAKNVNADLVIVLDTTYAEKKVRLGNGAVLTLKDDGIELEPAFAEKIIHLIAKNGVNIQTEKTYGYTETESFVKFSNCKKIISLLIAQRNNHSNKEQIDIRDIDSCLEAIRILCCTKLPLVE